LALAGALIDVGWSGADGAEVDDLGPMLWRDASHSHRVVVDVHPAVQRARLAHG